MLEVGQCDFIEDSVALTDVLSQRSSIKENHHQFVEEGIKKENIQWRKLILDWLEECNTKAEVVEQQ